MPSPQFVIVFSLISVFTYAVQKIAQPFKFVNVLFFITIVKNWSKILKNTSKMCVSYFVILMVMVTASFVMTEIVYVTSPMATIFWMCMSCLIQAASQSENKGVN